jgi:hypothetical protein
MVKIVTVTDCTSQIAGTTGTDQVHGSPGSVVREQE